MAFGLKTYIDIDDPGTPLKNHLHVVRKENCKYRSMVMRMIFDPSNNNQVDNSSSSSSPLSTLIKAQTNLALWHKLLMKYLRRTDPKNPELNLFLGEDKLQKEKTTVKAAFAARKPKTQSFSSMISPYSQHLKPFGVTSLSHLGPVLGHGSGRKTNTHKSQTIVLGHQPKTQKRPSRTFVSGELKTKRFLSTKHLKINSKPQTSPK